MDGAFRNAGLVELADLLSIRHLDSQGAQWDVQQDSGRDTLLQLVEPVGISGNGGTLQPDLQATGKPCSEAEELAHTDRARSFFVKLSESSEAICTSYAVQDGAPGTSSQPRAWDQP